MLEPRERRPESREGAPVKWKRPPTGASGQGPVLVWFVAVSCESHPSGTMTRSMAAPGSTSVSMSGTVTCTRPSLGAEDDAHAQARVLQRRAGLLERRAVSWGTATGSTATTTTTVEPGLDLVALAGIGAHDRARLLVVLRALAHAARPPGRAPPARRPPPGRARPPGRGCRRRRRAWRPGADRRALGKPSAGGCPSAKPMIDAGVALASAAADAASSPAASSGRPASSSVIPRRLRAPPPAWGRRHRQGEGLALLQLLARRPGRTPAPGRAGCRPGGSVRPRPPTRRARPR